MTKYKVYVTYSSTFFIRSRCKVCWSSPHYYYKDFVSKVNSIQEMFEEFRFKKRYLVRDYIAYHDSGTRFFFLSRYSYTMRGFKTTVKHHRTPDATDQADIFMCKCAHTAWFYSRNESLVSSMRKALNVYPKNVNAEIQEFK